MRTQKNYKTIMVDETTHKRLVEDREHFQEVIGGGIWSMNDTIREYHKILSQIKR